MDKIIKEEIESINISNEYKPSSDDYVRGHCLFKIEGYMQAKYVVYDEPLQSFKNTSKIYNYGINILKKYNLDIKEWTLIYHTNSEWYNTFYLDKK